MATKSADNGINYKNSSSHKKNSKNSNNKNSQSLETSNLGVSITSATPTVMPKASGEQMALSKMLDKATKTDDSKIKMVMELTQCKFDRAEMVLRDNRDDVEAAIDYIFEHNESADEAEWVTTGVVKGKKKDVKGGNTGGKGKKDDKESGKKEHDTDKKPYRKDRGKSDYIKGDYHKNEYNKDGGNFKNRHFDKSQDDGFKNDGYKDADKGMNQNDFESTPNSVTRDNQSHVRYNNSGQQNFQQARSQENGVEDSQDANQPRTDSRDRNFRRDDGSYEKF